MLFGQRPALQSAETNESGPKDIAIFPLAIPPTGPGTITSILLLTAQTRGSFAELAAIAGALALRLPVHALGARLRRRATDAVAPPWRPTRRDMCARHFACGARRAIRAQWNRRVCAAARGRSGLRDSFHAKAMRQKRIRTLVRASRLFTAAPSTVRGGARAR
jgi:hypothetical protein